MSRQLQHPNLEDIARKAGVSRSTVSRVINNDPYVSSRTRERVQAVIDAEGYSPNPAARMLVTQRTHVIGVVIPHTIQVTFHDPYYFPTMLQGVSETAHERDYATLLWWGQSRQDEERFSQRILQQNRLMDGLILASTTVDDALVAQLVERETPFVMVERPAHFQDRISYVSVDNVQAAENAVAHLIGLGRRRIGTITGALNNMDGLDRLTGYRNALETAGLPYDPALVAEGQFTRPSGYAGAKQLLRQNVDAIFAASDFTAMGAVQALQESGARIPDDVAIVGFDDLPGAVHVTPQLTTVRQPIHHKGMLATSILLDLIEGKIKPPQQVLLPTQLVIRQSCGALAY